MTHRPYPPSTMPAPPDAIPHTPPVHTTDGSLRLRLPSRQTNDPATATVMRHLEALPPLTRRHEVRARIRERNAELTVLADAHPSGPPYLRDLRVDDPLLNGLHLIDTLLNA